MAVFSLSGVAERLASLILTFDRDGPAGRRRIAQLLEADPDTFRDAAVETLKTPGDSRGLHFVIALLASHGLLLAVLCHPALKREQVLMAARAALRADPMADATIAKSLADGVMSSDPSLRPKNVDRLMDILSEISDGPRILPSLMRLLRHPDPHLRSKAVKMIGRRTRSAKWVRNRMSEADPRVRANAIESLWGVDTPEARELVRTCVYDSDNRVAGNALVALHSIGDCSVIPEFFRMAAHNSAGFRATAAWAMGATGDPRFSEALGQFLRDTSPSVRTRALASLGRIKAVLARARQTNPWLLAGMVHDNPQRSLRRVQLAIATEDGGEYPVALATQFLVGEDGRPVISYRTTEFPAPETMSVSFVFPRGKEPSAEPWIRGALRCRSWKRKSDLWSLQPYLPPEESEGSDRPADDPFRLTSSLETIGETFNQVPKRARCAGFWSAVLQALRPDAGGSRGKRHAIVFNCSEIGTPPPDELIPAILNGARLEVISTMPNAVLEDFCHRGRGVFRIAESPDEVAGLIHSSYLSLLTRYEIAYAPVSPECTAVKVRVQTASGWGEASIPVAGGPVTR